MKKIKQVTQPTVKKLNLVLNQRSEELKKEKIQVIIISKSYYKKLCKELKYKVKFYKGLEIEYI